MKGKNYEVLVSYEGRFLLKSIPTKLLKQPANFEQNVKQEYIMDCINQQHNKVYIIGKYNTFRPATTLLPNLAK
jgi:hypothetical protein